MTLRSEINRHWKQCEGHFEYIVKYANIIYEIYNQHGYPKYAEAVKLWLQAVISLWDNIKEFKSW